MSAKDAEESLDPHADAKSDAARRMAAEIRVIAAAESAFQDIPRVPTRRMITAPLLALGVLATLGYVIVDTGRSLALILLWILTAMLIAQTLVLSLSVLRISKAMQAFAAYWQLSERERLKKNTRP